MNRASGYVRICIVGDFNCSNVDPDYLVIESQGEHFIDTFQDNLLLEQESDKKSKILESFHAENIVLVFKVFILNNWLLTN